MPHYDLFVIGGGSGGVACARTSAALGAKVGLAEVDRLGGTCVNRGCVPKKLLVYASHVAEDICNAESLGWSSKKATFNWAEFRDGVQAELRRLNGIYDGLLEKFNVHVYQDAARFLDAKTVLVGSQTITADRFMIATGGSPFVPEFPGREHVIVSDDAFLLEKLPRKIAIIGGGYIAQEFAGIFHGLGVEVTLVVRSARLLRGFDADLAEHLRAEQVKKGIIILCASHVNKIEKTAEGLRVICKECDSKTYDQILFATGRRPNSNGLGLHDIGVKVNSAGAIAVDERMRTSIENIYAIGDVTDRINLTPVAIHEGRIFAANHFGGEDRIMDYTNIPTTIFSQPPLATVGLTEAQARERYDDVVIYKSVFRPMKYSLGRIEERTLMKLVVDGRTDRVVGVHMVGTDAGEIIQGFAVALKAGATKTQFDRTVGVHPSSAEEFVTMREPFIQ
ncbi:glutathione-disulfide reductase [Desulfopila sp. IMCC35006]|uniref:glutathione-disulfide reductase n=1 Tax=Desulfopila sp. IMCC35006 TaxID=2569542 RepID=UPI0010AD1AA4|nr:glutathione-disulfide reductase [Desulfopila sp. IMCC35006]TKB23869.1 glutathione-disulfide reductase [Desulfopila sp. IMCC35006]